MSAVLGGNIQRGVCCRESVDRGAVPEQSVSDRRDGCRPVSRPPRDDRKIEIPPFRWKSAVLKIHSLTKEDLAKIERIIICVRKLTEIMPASADRQWCLSAVGTMAFFYLR